MTGLSTLLSDCHKSINNQDRVHDAEQRDRNDLIYARTATTSA